MNDIQAMKFDEFVMLAGDKLVTDSRKVAAKFGKRHGDVIRAIRNLECSDDFTQRNFALCYENNELANGKPAPYFQMTKDGFVMLAMGFTGKAAMAVKEAYIAAFNAMAEFISSQKSLWQMFDEALLEYKQESTVASSCGKGLSRWRRIKHPLASKIELLKDQIQPSLLLN